MTRTLTTWRAAIALVVLTTVTVVYAYEGRSRHEPGPRRVVQWRSMGSWSGRGNAQTASFPTTTGVLRFNWRAEHAPAAAGPFQITLHSAVSGRPLLRAVDQQGPGQDVSYVDTAPRTLYAVIDAPDLDWSISIDEAVPFNVAP